MLLQKFRDFNNYLGTDLPPVVSYEKTARHKGWWEGGQTENGALSLLCFLPIIPCICFFLLRDDWGLVRSWKEPMKVVN